MKLCVCVPHSWQTEKDLVCLNFHKEQSNLMKHVTLAHEGPKLLQCKVFHDDFPRKCLLKKHIKSVHKKKSHYERSDKSFSWKGNIDKG